jgi:hypothetical protein
MSEPVPAAEFLRDFGRWQTVAEREAVPVSSDGRIAGYFVGPEEYEQFRRFQSKRRSFATVDLPDAAVEAIGASRMDERHVHLNALLAED